MKCESCKFFVDKPLQGKDQGECRFNPPTAIPYAQAGGVAIMTIVPPVNIDHFCGKWEAKSNA